MKEVEKALAEDRARHIKYLYNMLELAETNSCIFFVYEFSTQIEFAKKHYIHLYGEKTLKKWMKIIKQHKKDNN
jgi:hypothetical protein